MRAPAGMAWRKASSLARQQSALAASACYRAKAAYRGRRHEIGGGGIIKHHGAK